MEERHVTGSCRGGIFQTGTPIGVAAIEVRRQVDKLCTLARNLRFYRTLNVSNSNESLNIALSFLASITLGICKIESQWHCDLQLD